MNRQHEREGHLQQQKKGRPGRISLVTRKKETKTSSFIQRLSIPYPKVLLGIKHACSVPYPGTKTKSFFQHLEREIRDETYLEG